MHRHQLHVFGYERQRKRHAPPATNLFRTFAGIPASNPAIANPPTAAEFAKEEFL
jgi:hypothetical protein